MPTKAILVRPALNDAAVMVCLTLASAGAHAQLFSEADTSAAGYTQADIRPAIRCADLASLDLPDLSSAEANSII